MICFITGCLKFWHRLSFLLEINIGSTDQFLVSLITNELVSALTESHQHRTGRDKKIIIWNQYRLWQKLHTVPPCDTYITYNKAIITRQHIIVTNVPRGLHSEHHQGGFLHFIVGEVLIWVITQPEALNVSDTAKNKSVKNKKALHGGSDETNRGRSRTNKSNVCCSFWRRNLHWILIFTELMRFNKIRITCVVLSGQIVYFSILRIEDLPLLITTSSTKLQRAPLNESSSRRRLAATEQRRWNSLDFNKMAHKWSSYPAICRPQLNPCTVSY